MLERRVAVDFDALKTHLTTLFKPLSDAERVELRDGVADRILDSVNENVNNNFRALRLQDKLTTAVSTLADRIVAPGELETKLRNLSSSQDKRLGDFEQVMRHSVEEVHTVTSASEERVLSAVREVLDRTNGIATVSNTMDQRLEQSDTRLARLADSLRTMQNEMQRERIGREALSSSVTDLRRLADQERRRSEVRHEELLQLFGTTLPIVRELQEQVRGQSSTVDNIVSSVAALDTSLNKERTQSETRFEQLLLSLTETRREIQGPVSGGDTGAAVSSIASLNAARDQRFAKVDAFCEKISDLSARSEPREGLVTKDMLDSLRTDLHSSMATINARMDESDAALRKLSETNSRFFSRNEELHKRQYDVVTAARNELHSDRDDIHGTLHNNTELVLEVLQGWTEMKAYFLRLLHEGTAGFPEDTLLGFNDKLHDLGEKS